MRLLTITPARQIIHHHLTLLHSHARLLGALLKTTPAPSAARRGAVAGFLEGTRTMLGQVRAVQESNAGQTADAVAAVAVPVAGGRKRRKSERVERKRKRDSGELRSPGASDGEGEAREGGTGGRKVRKVDAPGEKVEENGGEAPMITPVGGERAGVETEDITAEVEARLKAKERARARLKEGGTKRRRRSSTVEVDERRREKRVRRARESLGEAVFEGAR